MTWSWAIVVVLGCDEIPEPLRGADPSALAVLTDQDPDPEVVHVSLVARETEIDLGGPHPSPAWVFADAAAPPAGERLGGPVLFAKPGDLVIVDFENQLSRTATTIHWHGIRLDSAMDGAGNHEGDEVFPGKSFQYRFVANDSGTFWYHPHVRSDEQIERGLYGAVVVREDREELQHT
jgi:FtsP/CotA-like multicopper oxidase with cupredoxin domain